MIPNMSVVIQVAVVYHSCSNKQSRTFRPLCLVNRWFLVKRLLAVMIIQKNKHPFYLEKHKETQAYSGSPDVLLLHGTWKQPTLVDLCEALNLPHSRMAWPIGRIVHTYGRFCERAREKLRVVLDICVQRKGLGGWYYQIQELNFVRKRSVFIQVWMYAFVK